MPSTSHSSPGWLRGVLIAAASALIALVFAIVAVGEVSGFPPKFERRDLQVGGASAHALVDFKRSRITDRRVTWDYFNTLRTRTVLMARLMASPPALEHIGRRAGIAPDQIAAVAPVTVSVSGALTEPASEQRAREIVLARKPYRLEIQSRSDKPILDIYAQAPSAPEAKRLAEASISGLGDYLRALAIRSGEDPNRQLRVTPLGETHASVLTPGASTKVALLAFLLAFGVAFATLYAAFGRRSGRSRAREEAREDPEHPKTAIGFLRPRVATLSAVVAPGRLGLPSWVAPVPSGGGAIALRPTWLRVGPFDGMTKNGNWPNTTRVLPWMVAAFLAVLWLVPFDSIEMAATLPVDLKFDRLVLPILVVTWVASLVIGGREKPRLGFTWIHGAVGAFIALACLSVILDAGLLSRSLELDTSFKKLPLLGAYLSLFVMMASIVRREEVAPFLKYTLVLAVICGLGMLWEYRMHDNLFFSLSDTLLPGFFEVDTNESGYDSTGRRLTHGPAAHGLVAVAMLSMALPIAVLGLTKAERTRDRILYGLAACVLMGAVFATQKKTGIVAPLAAVMTLAYFRRRELLKLAPVAVVLLIVVLIVSPATVAPVTDQFKSDRLQADTVNDRAADYDAIRPDVWSHVALGRGYGSYQPVGHRILDSELLVRTIEMGVIGLAAFVLLGFAVIACAKRLIESRHPDWAPSALAGAAAGAVFLVLAALFDTMSFPQVPYVFLCFAAFVAVLVTREA